MYVIDLLFTLLLLSGRNYLEIVNKMETQPLISVIIPVYNASRYISQCLESVLSQSYSKLQIICIDDHSTDPSLEILHSYAKQDSRITILTKENEGVSIARNWGIAEARGEYILFIDSDDWIEKNTCEIAVNNAMKGNYDVVMWSYIRERNGEQLPKKLYNSDVVFKTQSDVRSKLHRRMIGILDSELARPEDADALCTVWGKLYNSRIIREHNITFYDIREIGTYEDGLFNLDFFYYARSAFFLNRYLYHYRRTDNNSITNAYNSMMRIQWLKLFQILDDYISKNQLDECYRQALSNRIALSIIALGINIVSSKKNVVLQIAEIKQIITDKLYVDAICTLNKKYFPLYWKIFFSYVKNRNALGVYLLLIVIQKIRGK